MNTARDLAPEAFADHLADLLGREHGAMADFLLALADFDRDRGWAALGHASLWDFLHRRMGLSAGAAQLRKTAAGLLQRHPEVIEPLRDGRLCLSTVCELAKVVTTENQAEVLPRFFHRSLREAREVAVEILPLPVPRRAVVVALVARAVPAEPERAPTCAPSISFHVDETPAATTSARPAVPSPVVQPLTSDRSRLHLTVSRRFLKKLEAATAALSHAKPGADEEAILEAGLDLLLERQDRRRGLVKKPRAVQPVETAARPAEASRGAARQIPAAVRREVWARDGGRCSWPLSGGGTCGSTLRVELDHVVPAALGGPATVESLRCLCRIHNQEAARRVFGEEWMGRFGRRRNRCLTFGPGGFGSASTYRTNTKVP